ncbi:MAG: response regulator [Myxococcota bacterium]
MAESILVVDDDSLVLELIAHDLTENGYHVHTEASGAGALAAIAGAEFDVVIADLQMPEMGGTDLLRVLREHYPNVEVIVLTAHEELDAALECLRLGATDFIIKGPHPGPLLAAVARAVERRRLRSATDLHRASQAIFEMNDRADLPKRIVDVAMQVMAADNALLMLPTSNESWYLAYAHGGECHAELQALAQRVASSVAQQRRPALVSNEIQTLDTGARDDCDVTDSIKIRILKRARSCIAYPLCSGQRILGVLILERTSTTRPYRHADVTRTSILASHVALALEMQELMRRLVAAERFTAVGQMAASIAHDVNNPLGFVLANVQFVRRALRETGGAEELVTALDDAEEGVRRVVGIVADVRQVAQAQQHECTVASAQVLIQSAVRMTSATVRGRADIEMALDPRVMVRGMPGRLCQVFMNLLVNAADAIEEARRGRGRIVVGCRAEGTNAVAWVSDNGVGIPEQNRARLGEPFFTTKGPGKGTGLGLGICRDIVAAHGGALRFLPGPDGGTTVEVTLPLSGTTTHETTPECLPVASLTPSARVLCIDDEESQLRAYRRLLSARCSLEVESCPFRARDRLLRETFDVVLCDVLMPGLTGVDLYDELCRARPDVARRFVFVTGSMGLNHEALIAAASVPVLKKPVDDEALQALVSIRDERVDA